jgi:hypothetical protein
VPPEKHSGAVPVTETGQSSTWSHVAVRASTAVAVVSTGLYRVVCAPATTRAPGPRHVAGVATGVVVVVVVDGGAVVVVVDGGAVVVVVVLVEVLVVVVTLVGNSPTLPSRRARFQAFATSVQAETVASAVPADRIDPVAADVVVPAAVASVAGAPTTSVAAASAVRATPRWWAVVEVVAARTGAISGEAAANNPLDPQAPADATDRSRQDPRSADRAVAFAPPADGPTA